MSEDHELCPRCGVEMTVARTTSFASRNLELEPDAQLECPNCKARLWNWGKVATICAGESEK
jgi:RNA polymerase subunit RPABC4/transcription elongation factor Spt4